MTKKQKSLKEDLFKELSPEKLKEYLESEEYAEYLELIIEENRRQLKPKCTGGRYCYCAPFEDEPPRG